MSERELRWRGGSIGDRLTIIALQLFMWGVVFPAMLIGVLWFIGTASDHIVKTVNDLERCQKNAATPYEYHQCERH